LGEDEPQKELIAGDTYMKAFKYVYLQSLGELGFDGYDDSYAPYVWLDVLLCKLYLLANNASPTCLSLSWVILLIESEEIQREIKTEGKMLASFWVQVSYSWEAYCNKRLHICS